MFNQIFDQGLKRPVVANEIDIGWVWADAVFGPLFLNYCIGTFVAEFCKGSLRRRPESRRSAFVVLGQAGEYTKDGNGELSGNRGLIEDYIMPILHLHRLDFIGRRARVQDFLENSDRKLRVARRTILRRRRSRYAT